MLYIFNQDDKYQNIITEETGLIDTWFKDYQNHLIDEPFVFHVYSDSELLHLIVEENQVAFHDRDNRLRLMRIKEVYERSSSDGYIVEVKCEPSFLELYDHFIEDRRINNGTAQSALNSVLQGSRYTGNVTVDLGNQTTNFYWINGIDAIFKIIDVWGGALVDVIELDENNEIIERKIIIQQRLGADNGLLIEPDYNAETIERSTLSYPVTAMWGQGASLETENGGHTRYITFEDVEWSKTKGDPVDKLKGQKWVGDPPALQKYGYLNADGTRKHRFGHFSNQDYETAEELLMATWQALQEAKHPEVNHSSTINVDRPVSLGDTATIIDRNYNKPIEVQSQITGLEYDILEPDENVKVILGKYVDMNVDPIEKELDDLKQEVAKPRPTKPIDNNSYPDVKPGTPTNVQAIGSFQVIQLYWDYDSNVYVSHYEVYASKVADFVPDTQHLIYRGRVSAFAHEIQTDEMWYYRIRAVNTRGTPSNFSNQVSAASVRINTPDIMFGGIIADHLESNLDIAEKLAQNTIDRINEGPMQEIVYTQQQIEATEEAILNQLNSQIGDVNSAINDLNTTADSLKLRVDDTEDLLLQHGNKFTNIETEIDTIDGRISATITNVERIDNTVNSHSTTLTAHAGLINAKLDSLTYQQDKTGIVNRIESNETEIGLLSTGLELRVTKEEFEALSIGGRNLLIGTKQKVDALPQIIHNGVSYGSYGYNWSFSFEVDLIKNEKYTVKVPVYNPNATTIPSRIFVGHVGNLIQRILPYEEVVVSHTFKATENEEKAIIRFLVDGGNLLLGWQYPILIKGNKAIDWSPAPEDSDNQFATITNRVTKTETDLQVHAGLISAKAEKTDVYTKTEVNTRLNTKVETTVYNNKMGQLDVSINNITGRVSNTETSINGLTGEVNTANSQIANLEIEAGKIELRVSEIRTEFDNLEIGETNLIPDSNKKVTASTYMIKEYVISENFVEGEAYTVVIKGNINSGQAFGFWLNGGSNRVGSAEDMGNGLFRLTFKSVKINSGYERVLRVYNYQSSGAKSATIEWIKLVRADKTSLTWSPAPEDIDARVTTAEASIKTLAGQIELKASQTSVNSLTGRMTTAESQLNVLPGQISAKVDVNGVIASINLSKEGIRIAGNKHHITGQTLIDDAVIGTAAIANAAIARAHLQNAIIQNAHIADATIEHTKMKSVNADKITVGNLKGIDIYGAKFRSSAGTDYMEIVGGNIDLKLNNGRYMNLSPSGIYGYNQGGSVRFQADASLVTSAALGTSNDNIYLASNNEARVVNYSSIPGDGNVNSYSYLPIRSLVYRFPDIPNGYFTLLNGGEFRFTGENISNPTYQNLRANGYYGNFVETRASANILYLRASERIRTLGQGNSENYIDFQTGRIQAHSVRNNTETSGTHFYIGTGGTSTSELRVTTNGLWGGSHETTIYTDVRASGFFGNTFDQHSGVGGTHIYVRPSSGGELRVTRTGTTTTYQAVRASAFNESSSREYKTDIEKYNGQALDVINQLKVVNFRFKEEVDNGIDDLKIGFIAEDSETIATLDRKAIQTYKLSAYNTKAIQELDVKVYNIETRLDEKDLEMQYLKQKVQQQEKRIKHLEGLLEVA